MGKMFYWRESFGTMGEAECIDWVQVDGFRVVVAASLQNIYSRRSRPHKFESRDAWLGIGDL